MVLRSNAIFRDKHLFIAPLPDVEIRAGDRIQVSATVDMLKEYEALLGASVNGGT